jgi:putative ABC transport system ATP-binding protein
MISAQGISKSVSTASERLTILHDIDLDIEYAQTLAIVGASGSGKSTLLGILAGLDLPSGGRVLWDGVDITQLDEDARAQQRNGRVGFVFQSFQLLPGLTALENVQLPLELRGDRAAGEKARGYLERVGLAARLAHYPRQLSGGEQQRVAIARAFAAQPKVLFADEPTGNLDSATGEQITQLLFDMNAQDRTTLVLVTHDRNLAARCERSIVLSAGAIVQ